MSALLTGPAFRPRDKFYLLSLALEGVGPEHAAELLPLVTSAAMVVVRQLEGSVTDAEAYAHIRRVHLALETARLATPAPPTVAERIA